MSSSNYANVVQELYITYFGRPADFQGLQNFEAAMLAAGAPTDVVTLSGAYGSNAAVQKLVDGFGTSAESVLLYGQVSTDATSAASFVTTVFENLLNRAPAAAGLSFWVDAITSGSVSLGNAALSIAAGAMTNTSTQGLADATTIANKLAVASQFTASVANGIGIADYAGPAAALTARSLLAGVSSTTQAASYQDEVAQAVANLGAQATNNTYSLTPGTDSLTGGLGSNTFNAVLDNAAGVAAGLPAATLSQGDSITGGTDINILNITDFGIGSTLAIPAATLNGITALNVQSAEATGTIDFSSWSGLKSVNIGLSHGTDDVTVGAGMSLILRDTGSSGTVTTNGGASVAVYSDANHAVLVNGSSATKSASVNGGADVVIQDINYHTPSIAGVLAAASIYNPTGTSQLDSNALTALTVGNDAGQTINVNASVSLTAPLTLSLDGDTGVKVNMPDILGLNLSGINNASAGMILVAPQAGALSFNSSADLGIASLDTPNVIAVKIAGSGGLTADLSGVRGNATIDATNETGTVNLILDTQSFAGGAGADNITIDSLASTIAGGTSGSNSINFDNVSFSGKTNLSPFPNFQTWELSGTTSGTLSMQTANAYNNLIIDGAGGDLLFTSLHPDTPLEIEASDSHTITMQTSAPDVRGAAQDVQLGTTTTGGITVGDLAITGYLNQGAAILDLASYSTSGQVNKLNVLSDPSMSTLNVSGNAPLAIGGTVADAVSSLNINDSVATGASSMAGLNDAALSALALNTYAFTLGPVTTSATSFALIGDGAGAIAIGGIVDPQLTSLKISETSSSNTTVNTVTLAASQLPALQSLSLSDHVGATIGAVSYNAGFTLTAGGDNANVSLTSSGTTLTGDTDNINLGNGNDQVTLGQGESDSTQNINLGSGTNSVSTSSVGVVNIGFAKGTNVDSVNASGNDVTLNLTAGNGNNLLQFTGVDDLLNVVTGSGNNSIVMGGSPMGSVSIAAHGGSDSITIGVVGGLTNYANIVLVSGLNNTGNDTISFSDTAGTSSAINQVSAANVSASGGDTTSLASWIAAALGKGGIVTQTAHGIEWFQYGGNTYIIETSTSNDTGKFFSNDGVIELTGTNYTFAHSSFIGGVLHLNG